MTQAIYTPVLARHPDGRRSRFALFEPLAFAYLSLSLGCPIASLCALYNAVLLRRAGLAVRALSIGILAYVAFFVTVVALVGAGWKNFDLVRLTGAVVHVLFGVLLCASQWPHLRGHRHLGGKLIPLLGTVLAGFVLRLVLPPKALLFLLGVPL